MSKKDFDFRVFGVAKIGEKGQIVIPATAREKLNLKPRDEIVMFGSCEKQFMAAMKEEEFRTFMAKVGKKIDKWASQVGEYDEDNSEINSDK